MTNRRHPDRCTGASAGAVHCLQKAAAILDTVVRAEGVAAPTLFVDLWWIGISRTMYTGRNENKRICEALDDLSRASIHSSLLAM